MRRIGLIAGMFLLFTVIVPKFAFSALIWDWSFDNPTQIVGPTDTITLNAKLYNLSSDGTILKANPMFASSIFGYGTFWPNYTFNWDMFPEFWSISIAPGGSADFVFGQLSPNSPSVTAGTYIGSINLSLQVTPGEYVEYSHNFQATVSGAPVPEPSTMLLLGSGLLGLVGYSRRRFKK